MLRRQKKTARISVKQEVLDVPRRRTRASKGFKLAEPPPRPPRPLRTDTNPIPRDVIESVAEHLVATGYLRSLAAFNTVSRKDLEMDEDGKTRYWNQMMVDGAGARHIQSIVDRQHQIAKTKQVPGLILSALAHKSMTLEGYTAHFVDHAEDEHRLLANDDLKIITHLFSAYNPGTDDFIGPRNAYFLYVLHSSTIPRRYPIPRSLEERVLPAMPYVLDSVLIIPKEDNFVVSDRHRLAATTVDFFAAIDHVATPRWRDHFGSFTSIPQDAEGDCEGYVDFPWHDTPQSAVICAEAVGAHSFIPASPLTRDFEQTTQALEIARTTRRHWIELNFEIDTPFPDYDNVSINRIIDLIRSYYLERAPTRLEPAPHGGGDVTVGDGTEDLHACLKRILPGDYGRQREAVGVFIQRFPKGTGPRRTNAEVDLGWLELYHEIFTVGIMTSIPVLTLALGSGSHSMPSAGIGTLHGCANTTASERNVIVIPTNIQHSRDSEIQAFTAVHHPARQLTREAALARTPAVSLTPSVASAFGFPATQGRSKKTYDRRSVPVDAKTL